jgi:hypothetical protein
LTSGARNLPNRFAVRTFLAVCLATAIAYRAANRPYTITSFARHFFTPHPTLFRPHVWDEHAVSLPKFGGARRTFYGLSIGKQQASKTDWAASMILSEPAKSKSPLTGQ